MKGCETTHHNIFKGRKTMSFSQNKIIKRRIELRFYRICLKIL